MAKKIPTQVASGPDDGEDGRSDNSNGGRWGGNYPDDFLWGMDLKNLLFEPLNDYQMNPNKKSLSPLQAESKTLFIGS